MLTCSAAARYAAISSDGPSRGGRRVVIGLCATSTIRALDILALTRLVSVTPFSQHGDADAFIPSPPWPRRIHVVGQSFNRGLICSHVSERCVRHSDNLHVQLATTASAVASGVASPGLLRTAHTFVGPGVCASTVLTERPTLPETTWIVDGLVLAGGIRRIAYAIGVGDRNRRLERAGSGSQCLANNRDVSNDRVAGK